MTCTLTHQGRNRTSGNLGATWCVRAWQGWYSSAIVSSMAPVSTPDVASKFLDRTGNGLRFASHFQLLRSSEFGLRTLFLVLSLSSLIAVERPASASRLPRENLLAYHSSSGVIAEVRIKSDWERRKQEIIAGFHSVAGEFPVKARLPVPQMSVEAEVDCGSYVRRAITYETEPGSRVPAYLLVPKTRSLHAEAPGGAGAAFHGYGVRPPRRGGASSSANRAYAHDLAERGFVVLAPAYPLMGSYHPDLKALGTTAVRSRPFGTIGAGSICSNPCRLFGAAPLAHWPFPRWPQCDLHGRARTTHQGGGLQLRFDSFVDYMDGKIDGWCSERYMPRLRDYRDRLSETPSTFMNCSPPLRRAASGSTPRSATQTSSGAAWMKSFKRPFQSMRSTVNRKT